MKASSQVSFYHDGKRFPSYTDDFITKTLHISALRTSHALTLPTIPHNSWQMAIQYLTINYYKALFKRQTKYVCSEKMTYSLTCSGISLIVTTCSWKSQKTSSSYILTLNNLIFSLSWAPETKHCDTKNAQKEEKYYDIHVM